MDKKIQDLENQLLSPELANSDENSYLAPTDCTSMDLAEWRAGSG